MTQVELGPGGIPGDRAWAVRDEVKGGIRGAKKIPALMQCGARYPTEPTAAHAGNAEMTLPHGDTVSTDAPDVAEQLTAALGQPVTLWPLLPADQLDHYRRGAPAYDDLEQEWRSVFGRLPDEPLPDLSVFPPELMEFESPPGTYFDAFPLMLMTDASLAHLQSFVPESKIDVRRFRPNFLIETTNGATGFVESAWEGQTLRIGGATVQCTVVCPRCVMPTLGFADLPKDPQILRALVRDANQNLGVYATIATPATVSVGDPVDLVD